LRNKTTKIHLVCDIKMTSFITVLD